jgi:hypothetical protein
MDKRLFAVVAVGVLFGGAAHAIDCQKLPMQMQLECEKEKRTAEIGRLSFACGQLKLANDRLKRLGIRGNDEDEALAEQQLRLQAIFQFLSDAHNTGALTDPCDGYAAYERVGCA